MKKTSIGTWAYNVGPYGENPIPFDTVGETLSKLKFDGLELGGFNGYPNPQNIAEEAQLFYKLVVSGEIDPSPEVINESDTNVMKDITPTKEDRVLGS